ncbi:MAG: hypothetical protein M0R46_17110 [Candidatus Muirbacterium halophilum]|nr:hypothetical protein [Candidatus Muirbacterium halophilum]MCK9477638.1 hypothetical protein [Candidatus Muirbacterium halophilum]
MKIKNKKLYLLNSNIQEELFLDMKDFLNWIRYFRNDIYVLDEVYEKYKDVFEIYNITFDEFVTRTELIEHITKRKKKSSIVLIEDNCNDVEDLADIVFWTGDVTCCDKGCEFYYVKNFSMIKETLQTIHEVSKD